VSVIRRNQYYYLFYTSKKAGVYKNYVARSQNPLGKFSEEQEFVQLCSDDPFLSWSDCSIGYTEETFSHFAICEIPFPGFYEPGNRNSEHLMPVRPGLALVGWTMEDWPYLYVSSPGYEDCLNLNRFRKSGGSIPNKPVFNNSQIQKTSLWLKLKDK